MRTAEEWFAEYAESHQNPTNVVIHKICVPAIYFSIIGMLASIDTGWLAEITRVSNPYVMNWAVIVAVPVMIFYALLGFRYFLWMLVFTFLCNLLAVTLKEIYHLPLFYISLFVFVVAWAGQFYGHKVEGKKPSFLKDLVFLLIGPVWVFKKMGLLGK